MKKKIAILGSTGSIGKQTLEIIKKNKNNFEISLLTADKNHVLLSKQIKELCKYPKQGGLRGLGLVRQNKWGLAKDLISASPILIAQIETLKAVNNIKEITGFDYYMIGPYDLSASLGCPAQFDNPLFTKSVNKVKILSEDVYLLMIIMKL